jgi:hypothetical protein
VLHMKGMAMACGRCYEVGSAMLVQDCMLGSSQIVVITGRPHVIRALINRQSLPVLREAAHIVKKAQQDAVQSTWHGSTFASCSFMRSVSKRQGSGFTGVVSMP